MASSCGCLECGEPSSSAATNAGPRLLVGILSAPQSGARRRDTIRTSWMRWRGVGEWLLPCFGLGSRGLSRRMRRKFGARDVIWLDVEEIGVLSIPKVLAWWRVAATAMAHFTHAAKVDDDSFLHVPNLLRALPEARSLCFGPLAHAGYDPARFRMCGWSWQRSYGAWRRMKCKDRGFSPPHPFPLGAMQLLSRDIVRALGTSADVRQFAVAANLSADLRKRESNEDVALGYWIWRLSEQHGFNVSYMNINDRATNLGCFRNGGLYQRPRADAVVIHRIKGARGMTYVWGMLHDGKPHDPIDCARDARVELPQNSFIFDPKFAARVRAGEATLDFDAKTNMISMRFTRRLPPGILRAGQEQNRTQRASRAVNAGSLRRGVR